MIVEKLHPSGGWLICALIGGRLITRRYFGYSKRVAVAMFNRDTRRLD